MNAYAPSGPDTLVLTVAVLAATLAAAFGLSRLPSGRVRVCPGTGTGALHSATARGLNDNMREPVPCSGQTLTRLLAWALLVVAFLAVERLTSGEPAGFRMLAIVGALLLGMKGIVSVEFAAAGQKPLGRFRWLAFAVGWPGMRAATFRDVPGPARDGSGDLLLGGCLSLAVGAGCVAIARAVELNPSLFTFEPARRLVVAAFLLTGLSLLVHFGVFNVLAGLWRLAGADCRALFRAPIRSRSLAEFWSRRWNLAFSEMSVVAVYRPLCRVVGRRGASAAVFLFSGVMHELAISVPVGAGYGLPLTYFVLHGIAVQIEDRLERAGRPVSGRPWIGRLWTAAWLIVPLPMLFHAPFLDGVVFPLIRTSHSSVAQISL